jgi:replication factor A1
MKISEAQPNSNATLDEVEVVSKGDIREFMRFDKPGKVCNCVIKDGSGEMQLTLWNDEIGLVDKGDTVKIEDGWVKEWNGKLQISKGKNGKIEKL